MRFVHRRARVGNSCGRRRGEINESGAFKDAIVLCKRVQLYQESRTPVLLVVGEDLSPCPSVDSLRYESEIMPKRRAPAAAPAAAMALLAHAAASASMAPSAGSADSNAQPVDVAVDAAQAPPGPSPLEVEEQPLEKLPDGKAYDSCDEDDGPSCILEDESLVALARDKEEVVDSAATGTASGSSAKQPAKVSGGSPSKSPTRARTIITGVANALKKLTAKEQKKEAFHTASAFFLSCSDWCSALHRTTKSGCR